MRRTVGGRGANGDRMTISGRGVVAGGGETRGSIGQYSAPGRTNVGNIGGHGSINQEVSASSSVPCIAIANPYSNRGLNGGGLNSTLNRGGRNSFSTGHNWTSGSNKSSSTGDRNSSWTSGSSSTDRNSCGTGRVSASSSVPHIAISNPYTNRGLNGGGYNSSSNSSSSGHNSLSTGGHNFSHIANPYTNRGLNGGGHNSSSNSSSSGHNSLSTGGHNFSRITNPYINSGGHNSSLNGGGHNSSLNRGHNFSMGDQTFPRVANHRHADNSSWTSVSASTGHHNNFSSNDLGQNYSLNRSSFSDGHESFSNHGSHDSFLNRFSGRNTSSSRTGQNLPDGGHNSSSYGGHYSPLNRGHYDSFSFGGSSTTGQNSNAFTNRGGQNSSSMAGHNSIGNDFGFEDPFVEFFVANVDESTYTLPEDTLPESRGEIPQQSSLLQPQDDDKEAKVLEIAIAPNIQNNCTEALTPAKSDSDNDSAKQNREQEQESEQQEQEQESKCEENEQEQESEQEQEQECEESKESAQNEEDDDDDENVPLSVLVREQVREQRRVLYEKQLAAFYASSSEDEELQQMIQDYKQPSSKQEQCDQNTLWTAKRKAKRKAKKQTTIPNKKPMYSSHHEASIQQVDQEPFVLNPVLLRQPERQLLPQDQESFVPTLQQARTRVVSNSVGVRADQPSCDDDDYLNFPTVTQKKKLSQDDGPQVRTLTKHVFQSPQSPCSPMRSPRSPRSPMQNISNVAYKEQKEQEGLKFADKSKLKEMIQRGDLAFVYRGYLWGWIYSGCHCLFHTNQKDSVISFNTLSNNYEITAIDGKTKMQAPSVLSSDVLDVCELGEIQDAYRKAIEGVQYACQEDHGGKLPSVPSPTPYDPTRKFNEDFAEDDPNTTVAIENGYATSFPDSTKQSSPQRKVSNQRQFNQRRSNPKRASRREPVVEPTSPKQKRKRQTRAKNKSDSEVDPNDVFDQNGLDKDASSQGTSDNPVQDKSHEDSYNSENDSDSECDSDCDSDCEFDSEIDSDDEDNVWGDFVNHIEDLSRPTTRKKKPKKTTKPKATTQYHISRRFIKSIEEEQTVTIEDYEESFGNVEARRQILLDAFCVNVKKYDSQKKVEIRERAVQMLKMCMNYCGYDFTERILVDEFDVFSKTIEVNIKDPDKLLQKVELMVGYSDPSVRGKKVTLQNECVFVYPYDVPEAQFGPLLKTFDDASNGVDNYRCSLGFCGNKEKTSANGTADTTPYSRNCTIFEKTLEDNMGDSRISKTRCNVRSCACVRERGIHGKEFCAEATTFEKHMSRQFLLAKTALMATEHAAYQSRQKSRGLVPSSKKLQVTLLCTGGKGLESFYASLANHMHRLIPDISLSVFIVGWHLSWMSYRLPSMKTMPAFYYSIMITAILRNSFEKYQKSSGDYTENFSTFVDRLRQNAIDSGLVVPDANGNEDSVEEQLQRNPNNFLFVSAASCLTSENEAMAEHYRYESIHSYVPYKPASDIFEYCKQNFEEFGFQNWQELHSFVSRYNRKKMYDKIMRTLSIACNDQWKFPLLFFQMKGWSKWEDFFARLPQDLQDSFTDRASRPLNPGETTEEFAWKRLRYRLIIFFSVMNVRSQDNARKASDVFIELHGKEFLALCCRGPAKSLQEIPSECWLPGLGELYVYILRRLEWGGPKTPHRIPLTKQGYPQKLMDDYDLLDLLDELGISLDRVTNCIRNYRNDFPALKTKSSAQTKRWQEVLQEFTAFGDKRGDKRRDGPETRETLRKKKNYQNDRTKALAEVKVIVQNKQYNSEFFLNLAKNTTTMNKYCLELLRFHIGLRFICNAKKPEFASMFRAMAWALDTFSEIPAPGRYTTLTKEIIEANKADTYRLCCLLIIFKIDCPIKRLGYKKLCDNIGAEYETWNGNSSSD